MDKFRTEAVAVIADLTDLSAEEVDGLLTTPPKPEMGDFAFPCFPLAKTLKKAPPAIAAELAEKAPSSFEHLERLEAMGPYLNVWVNKSNLAESVLRDVIRQGESYGTSTLGADKTICIDYSHPNIAKPFHVGHMRSTIIGAALYRLHKTLGYTVIGINHLGDWGTQFGKQVVGLKHWGSPDDVNDLEKLKSTYVKYHEEETDELLTEARDWFRRMEEGDTEALELWQAIRDTSVGYLQTIYSRLGVEFDSYDGEAFFNDKMEPVLAEADSKGITTVSDGATIVDLTDVGIDTPALLKKSDGATLYLTRDLAAIIYRKTTYNFHKLLYVVSMPQSLHFQQLFAVLRKMGYDWADDCEHIKFGMVKGMSTRSGNTIYLEEFLDEARDRALTKMREAVEKRPEDIDEQYVAEKVGQAAVLFWDLARNRVKDYEFDWDAAISFEGDTGPYLLNAHARIAGIIRNGGVDLNPDADVSPLTEPEAQRLVSLLGEYPAALEKTAETCEPSQLCQYLLDLAHALHSSYRILRVKDAEKDIAEARLLLFACVKHVLANGLRILGITPLDKM
jgi:arginyl-tRNA synthetase